MNTPNLQAPLLAAGQAQKHVTVNEALLIVDDLLHIRADSFRANAPPAQPDEASRHVVGPLPTGAWAGKAGMVAVWRDGLWTFHAPRAGWSLIVAGEEQPRIHDGVDWQPVKRVGVNTTADAANPLAVSGPATLFTHAGQGHQLKLNKAGAGDAASLLFQTGYSGRAEIGTVGTDALSFKVSPDGAAWTTALSVDSVTGLVSLPAQPLATARQNWLINGDCALNQREFAGGALDPGSYGFDRWRAAPSGAVVQRAGKVVTLTSGGIEQPVEADLWGLESFAGKVMTLSVENPSATLSVDIAGATGVITAGSGRRAVVLTLPGAAGATAIVRLSGTNVAFERVKLEEGAGATPWLPRPLTLEEQLARRYFIRLSGAISVYFAAQNAGGFSFDQLALPVAMRAVPTVTRIVSQSSNLQNADVANAKVLALNPSLLQLSARAHGPGVCYAFLSRIDCSAELA